MVAQPPPALLWPLWRPIWAFISRGAAASRGLNLTLTSWYRSPRANAAAGGHPASQHLLGLAADFVGRDSGELVRRARSLGLIAVAEPDHIHLQLYERSPLRRD